MPKKPIIKKTMHTELNIETGEMARIYTDECIGITETEPDYIKIYIGTQLCLNNLDPSLAPYIIAFGPHMSYANDSQYQHMVRTDAICRQGVAKTLGVTPKRVEQIIKLLIENGIFIPITYREEKDGVITERRRRGIYFVNPWVVAKGSWKDIKKLQQSIDFVKGESSYLISDEAGTRQIKCALPQKMYQQLNLEDFGI